MDYMPVTNFALNCRFFDSARLARNPLELQSHLSSDHRWGFACLWVDSRPTLEKPTEPLPDDLGYWNEYYSDRIYRMVPLLQVSLNIVKDILFMCDIRYDDKMQRFSGREKHAFHQISQAIFEYPDFEPFRIAYIIIVKGTAPYQTFPRSSNEGEFCYSLEFKLIEELESPKTKAIPDLLHYVLNTTPDDLRKVREYIANNNGRYMDQDIINYFKSNNLMSSEKVIAIIQHYRREQSIFTNREGRLQTR
jgi:hypothetical protein